MKTRIYIIIGTICLLAMSAKSATPREVSDMALEGYRLFTRDSLPDDRERGYAMMLDAAWEGDAKAANNVGWLMEHGEYGDKSLSGALRWYERAADQKLPAAALNYVGLIFRHPEIVEGKQPDTKRIANAALLAGKALAMGRGLHYDYRQGEELIVRAGLLGNREAAETIAQQLEIYPDSFSYLPLGDIAEECDALLPEGKKNLIGVSSSKFADMMLSPDFWYARAGGKEDGVRDR